MQDVTGQKFGRLTAIQFIENDKQNKPCWLFKCDCGKSKIIRLYSVKNGRARSCGCFAKELSIILGKSKITHGDASHANGLRIYRIWNGMKSRCNSPKRTNYYQRGINICDEWEKYLPFKKWALSHGYSDDLTIDRIDNNGNYSPENCRWVSMTEQNRNKRTSVYLTLNGITKHINEWVSMMGINKSTLRSRLRRGWTIQKALATPKL